MLYRSEAVKWSAGRILWRTFTLQSTDIARRHFPQIAQNIFEWPIFQGIKAFVLSTEWAILNKIIDANCRLPSPSAFGRICHAFQCAQTWPRPRECLFCMWQNFVFESKIFFKMVYEDSRHRKKAAGTFELCRLHEVEIFWKWDILIIFLIYQILQKFKS